MHPIPGREHVEASPHGPGRTAFQPPEVEAQEQGHGQGLVDLHRMAAHPVAEIHRPGQGGRRPVGVVRKPGEQAPPAPDHDPECEGPREGAAGRAPHAAHGLVDLHTHDGPRQDARDRVREGRGRADHADQRARQIAARHRADPQRREIPRPQPGGRFGHLRTQPPEVEGASQSDAAKPCRGVEQRVEQGVGRNVDHVATSTGRPRWTIRPR